MSWDVVDLEQRLAATIPPRSKQLSLASSRHELHVLWHLCTPMRRVLENRYVKVALQLLIAGRISGVLIVVPARASSGSGRVERRLQQ